MANEEQSVEEKAGDIFSSGIIEDEPTEIEEFDDKGTTLEERQAEPEEELAEPDDEPVVEGDDAPEAVEIEFEGTLYEVPIALQDAFLKNADYTQKTQDVSTKAKEVEVLQGAVQLQKDQYDFAQSIQGDVLKAQQLEDQALQTHKYLKDNVDELSAVDITKLQMAIDESRSERDKIVSGLQGKQQDFQQAQQQANTELLKQGTEVLRQRISSWGEESQKQVRTYALEIGFTDNEIQSVVDPRQVEVLWKASQYDALQQGKAAAVQKVVSAPSIKDVARNPMPEDVKAKLNLRKTLKNPKLTSKTKARAIQKEMGNRFG